MQTRDDHVRVSGDAPDSPLPLCQVLEEEYAHLCGVHRRPEAPDAFEHSHTDGVDARLERIRQRMRQRELGALCLSGGGIRSASFALGLIQGLARRGVLQRFDYLSTVSGGGFAGSWLTGWLHQALKDGDRDSVFRDLAGTAHGRGAVEPAPISRVRSYSRYMSPQLGALSADTWTLIGTIVRNLFLNWMVLLPLLAAVMLVPRMYLELVEYFDQRLEPGAALSLTAAPSMLLWASLALLAVSLGFVVADLPSYGNARRTQRQFLVWCLAPLVLGMVGLSLFWAVDVVPPSLRVFVIASVAGHTAAWTVVGMVTGRRWWRPATWIAAAASAPILAIGMWWLTDGPFRSEVPLAALYCMVAVPLALVFVGLTTTTFVGLASREEAEADLEWWSRYGAWLLIVVLAWLSVTGVVYYAPEALRLIRDQIRDVFEISTVTATGALGAVASAVSTAAAYLVRSPSADTASARPSPIKQTLLGLMPILFVLVLLGGIAWVNVGLLNLLFASGLLAALQFTPAGYYPDDVTMAEIVAVAAGLAVVGLVMARFVPVNKFSLHGMYRARLIRAFLGASRPPETRAPNPFTGLDPADNFPMSDLRDIGTPLHVVNMTLNLVADKDLASQFRKAESFTASPLHAGSCRLDAYRPTREYADEGIGGTRCGMSLGTAVTISGAAASPNMGARSSAPMTFLMTLFNARLGVWLGHPGAAGQDTWRLREPRVGVGPLLRELLGQTTDANPYVYLSDGGHFENLALWEMVMRRCRYVLVSDAGCDPDYTFEDLANAVRSIRMDLGVPIVFPGGIEMNRQKQGRGNPHYAVGRIQYSAVDGPLAEDGILIYVKAAVSGDEPIDVLNYAKGSPAFPHEPTSNQWFTEAQFESYRVLGAVSAAAIAPEFDGLGGLRGFFEAAERVHGSLAPGSSPAGSPEDLLRRAASPVGS